MSFDANNPPAAPVKSPVARRRSRSGIGFLEDFKRFFLGGVKALLPTLITVTVVAWIWNVLWESLGRYLIDALKLVESSLAAQGLISFKPYGYIGRYWGEDRLQTRVVGVLLAIVAVYVVGLFVGHLIGRALWKLGERMVMKVPIIRAIYPAVKQITDFVLADHGDQFRASRVVAVQPHDGGIWSVGLVTGGGLGPLTDRVGEEMITVFVPSSPTAFSGYVLVVPRSGVVELPMSVEEALRLLVSGGVIAPSVSRGQIAVPESPTDKEDRALEEKPAA